MTDFQEHLDAEDAEEVACKAARAPSVDSQCALMKPVYEKNVSDTSESFANDRVLTRPFDAVSARKAKS